MRFSIEFMLVLLCTGAGSAKRLPEAMRPPDPKPRDGFPSSHDGFRHRHEAHRYSSQHHRACMGRGYSNSQPEAMEHLDPITRQYLGEINSYKDRSGMSTTELARRLGLSDSNVGKKLRGEVAMSATELVQITWLFKIEFTEYFLVGLGDLPESTRPQRKEKR